MGVKIGLCRPVRVQAVRALLVFQNEALEILLSKELQDLYMLSYQTSDFYTKDSLICRSVHEYCHVKPKLVGIVDLPVQNFRILTLFELRVQEKT